MNVFLCPNATIESFFVANATEQPPRLHSRMLSLRQFGDEFAKDIEMRSMLCFSRKRASLLVGIFRQMANASPMSA